MYYIGIRRNMKFQVTNKLSCWINKCELDHHDVIAYDKRHIGCTFHTEPVKFVIAATPNFNMHH